MKPRLLGPLLALVLGACGNEPPSTGDTDFAILAQAAEGYSQAVPGRVPEFPADHGAHPDFRIEWWYLTANLADDEGRAYGAQWTLFRTAVRPPGSEPTSNAWQSDQVYMAHFALTWPQGHRGFQRYARGGDHAGEAQAAVRAQPFAAWLDHCSLHSMSPPLMKAMAAATPGAEYVEIPNAGHVPNINRPEAFNTALAAFLEKRAPNFTGQ